MKRVLTAVVLIPAVLLLVVLAPNWLLTIVTAGVALLALREYFAISEAYGIKPFRVTTYLVFIVSFAAAGVILSWPTPSEQGIFLLLLALLAAPLTAPVVMLAVGMRRGALATALPSAAFSSLAIPYLALPLISLLFIRGGLGGPVFLLFLFVTVWIGDICAYYVGTSVGRHAMAPRISPNKTWEGAAASLLGGALVGALVLSFSGSALSVLQGVLHAKLGTGLDLFEAAPLWMSVLVAVPVNIAAQLGDLVESMMKRGAGIKDSGSLLPGHGGVLDRIDALLFAAPVGMLLFITARVFFFHY